MIKKNKLLRIFIFAFVFRFILSFMTWHIDVLNHVDWGIRFFEYGPEKFYTANVWNFTWPNQPPGTIYMFAFIRKLYESVFNIFWWINVNLPLFPSGIITYFESNLYPSMLKLPAILADMGIAFLIYKILIFKDLKKYAGVTTVIFLANPVIWYNSSIWGQYDSVINFLVLLSVYFLLKQKLVPAVLAFVISIYIKATLLIFMPILFIYALRQKYSFRTWMISALISTIVIGLLTYPFADKNAFVWLFELYKDKIFVNQLQIITANAFNLWAGLTGIHEQQHSLQAGPLTYQHWGLLLFTAAYIPALYLLYKKQTYKSLFWALAVTAFSSFMLLTNMHERYLYPLFIPLTILLAVDRRLLKLYILISIINLLNLYNFWWTPRVEPLIELMSANDRLLPRLLGYFNFGLYLVFYKFFLRQNKLTKL